MPTTTVALGQIRGENILQYHQVDAFSNSKLKDFCRLPALYHGRYITKTIPKRKQTKALSVGSALDHLLLDGVDEYNLRIAVEPSSYLARYGTFKPWHNGAKYCDEWSEAHKEKIIISAAEAEQVKEMSDAAYADPDIAALLGEGEAGVTWRADFGFALGQCRTDWWNPKGITLPSTGEPTGPYFVELKSAASLLDFDYHSFEKQFVNLGYHRQVALYRAIIQQVQYEAAGRSVVPPKVRSYIVVVDKTEIPQAAVFEPSSRFHALSHAAVERTLGALATCYETNVWPGRPPGVQMLELPKFEEERLMKAED